MNPVRLFFIASALVLLHSPVVGQQFIRNNSPYSRFGFGDMLPEAFVAQQGIGSLTAAYNSYFSPNFINPAGMAHLRYAAFEVGTFYKTGQMSSGNLRATANDGGLHYLSLAFPITRHFYNPLDTSAKSKRQKPQWGMGFNIQPNSQVAYSVTGLDSSDANVGRIAQRFRGRGTRYQFSWSNGVRYKGLSAGLQVSYLFGTTYHTEGDFFLDQPYAYHDTLFDATRNRGVLWQGGVQYTINVPRRHQQDVPIARRTYTVVTLGAYASAPSRLSTEREDAYLRVGSPWGVDTIAYQRVEGLHTTLPTRIGGGIVVKQEAKWLVGADAEYRQWTSFAEASSPNLYRGDVRNTFRVGLGGEYLPDVRAYGKFFKRLTYRAGAFYETDHRVVNGLGLRRYGINLGLGMPLQLRNQPSFVQFSVELGQFGHPDLILENYFRLGVGLTLNDDSWFRRSRYK